MKKSEVIVFSDGSKTEYLTGLRKKTLVLLTDSEYKELMLMYELETLDLEIEKLENIKEESKNDDKVSLFKVLSGKGKHIKSLKFFIVYWKLRTN